jgi:Tfp pilus assembly protein FimT
LAGLLSYSNTQKQDTMMKIAVMAIALVMGSIAFGQPNMKKMTPEQRAQNLTTKMTKQLALNDDQAMKISEINQGIAQKNESIRTDANMSKEQKKEIMQSNHDARMSMYKNVLTTEQYTKCEQLEKERMERKAAKKAAAGTTEQAPAAPEEDEL